MTINLAAHMARQAAFSRATFGPGTREKGVIKHIEKELVEVANAETSLEKCKEWTDVSILGMDGLLRASREHLEQQCLEKREGAMPGLFDKHPTDKGRYEMACRRHPWPTWDDVAGFAVAQIIRKQQVNELRDWPDWRASSPDQAIEHDRSND